MRHGMGCPLYAGLKTCSYLEAPTGRICLIPYRLHYEYGNGLAERLPYPYGVYPWELIQCNESTRHQIMVGVPGGAGS